MGPGVPRALQGLEAEDDEGAPGADQTMRALSHVRGKAQDRGNGGLLMTRHAERAFAVILVMLAPAAQAQLVNENLLVAMPEGYKVGWQDRKPDHLINEMVPAGQTVENWTEMVTVRIFFNRKSTPDAYRAQLEKAWTAACPKTMSQPVAQGPERGYAAAVWMQVCFDNPQTGKPEHTFFKAIAGNDSFYVVEKAFKYAPAREEVVKWTRYLKDVAVCDSRLPDRACPATKN
jgi:hypothetical protein